MKQATLEYQDVRQEMGRRLSNKERLLFIMGDGAWHTNHYLTSIGGMRFGARILELRAHSVIHRRDDGGGQWSFRLDSTRAVLSGCDCHHCSTCQAATASYSSMPSVGHGEARAGVSVAQPAAAGGQRNRPHCLLPSSKVNSQVAVAPEVSVPGPGEGSAPFTSPGPLPVLGADIVSVPGLPLAQPVCFMGETALGEVSFSCGCGRVSARVTCSRCGVVWCSADGHAPHGCFL